MPSVSELCRTGQLKAAFAQAEAYLTEYPTSAIAHAEMHRVMLAYLKKATAKVDTSAAIRCLSKLADLALPAHPSRDEQLFWEVRALVAALSKKQPVPGEAISELLTVLATVPVGAEPSKGRSVLLQASLKCKEHLPFTWWAWWNLDLLRPEDFEQESFTPHGASKPVHLPAVAETAYGTYAAQLISRLQMGRQPGAPAWLQTTGQAVAAQTRASVDALLPRLEQLAATYPQYGWLDYRRAKLLAALGEDLPTTLAVLLPVVRRKSSEFWAWRLLAETLDATDAATATACYYRATTCGAEEKFLRGLRLTLANRLQRDFPSEARWQLQKAEKTTKAEGWPVRGEMLSLLAQLAQHPSAPAADARRRWLETAEAAVYGDLPWQSVVLSSVRADAPDKPGAIYLLPPSTDGLPRSLSVPLRRFKWVAKLPLGTPLQVRSELVNGKPRVLQVQQRPAGQAWDSLPPLLGVVTGCTPDRARAFVTVRPGLRLSFATADFGLAELGAGDAVRLWLQSRIKDGNTLYSAVAAEKTTEQPEATIYREFAGPLQLHAKGFGFVDNIFLPPHLITRQGWQDGEQISGRAVLSYNKHKEKEEWNVLVSSDRIAK
ncbi:hypothetical protein J0X19_23065 [Hymenobacter sp. BT186]|uniref:TOTE conflict systems S1/CSD-like domain-containing protein n=1 Tax=Hymenobacter telluris TaxID=2816474 RepID=A0A939F101_9BACT|nr:hypothetical protein [Hymenobacter telluris]MBO0360859.1 hypothetical protein [Hymenobacter telluris]MBW3376888.1 hypothetical protein [Hymenobacter norwichensis]